MDNIYILIIFSENLAGVLNQVTNVFTRRQLNIESLNVSPSGIDGVHRYTITTRTNETMIQLVCRQIEKKIDVIQAQYYTKDEVFMMEQALYKLEMDKMMLCPENSKAIRKYDARIVEVNTDYCIVAQEGSHRETSELYYFLKESGCLRQAVASGIIAVSKSSEEPLADYLEKRAQQGKDL